MVSLGTLGTPYFVTPKLMHPTLTQLKLRDDEVTVVGTCRAYTPAPNNLKSSTDADRHVTLNCWIIISSNDKKMLVWMSGASRKRAHDLKCGSNRYKLPTDSKITRDSRLASGALISPSSTIGEPQKSFPSHIMLRLVICSSAVALSVS